MEQLVKNDEVPIGFSMALAMNTDALNAFSTLDSNKKKDVINQSRQVHSRNEMNHFVSGLTNNDRFH